MSLLPRLPLFAATFTLLSLALALVFLSGQSVPAAQAQTTTPTTATTVDYDSNDDRLIEISNLAQLNAVRWDLDGNGAVATADQTNYAAAFPNAAAGMGCPDGSDADTTPDPCLGYELKADLTFDTNGDGSVTAADSGGLYWNSGAGWTPLGDARNYPFTGQFQGRGNTISHLFINNATAPHLGLFGAIGHRGSVAGVGLTEVSIASSVPTTAGSLVGSSTGRVTTSYATGAIAVNISSASRINAMAGGLVGYNGLAGTIQASFAEVAVSVRHSSASAIVGGLAGQSGGSIQASYAAGAVSGHGNTRFTKVGGLTGNNGGTINASYARGQVTATGSGAAAGGLVGGNLRNGRVVASYWDTTTSGQSGSAGGTGQTTNALQAPSGYNYNGIYAGWNLNLDGVAGGDSPWYFGGPNQYPILAYGAMRDFPLWDYDADNDQLIEVNSLAQLNALRWDLNTDGVVAAADKASYTAAFPGAVAGMGCALGTTAAACAGYELMSDLDFDTDGDGDVDAADSSGLYWNGGWGWRPIGFATNGLYIGNLTGTFQGNGKTISNLYINQPPSAEIIDNFGLFGWVGTGVIDGVNLRDVNIRIQLGGYVGALAGTNYGTIRDSSATGRINSEGHAGESVGGLVGENYGSIASSYAKVEISADDVSVGGLAGRNSCLSPDYTICGSIVASYTSGADVTVNRSVGGGFARVGGLVGVSSGPITASYSRSQVKATGNGVLVGGLVGANYSTITASYSRSPVEVTGNGASVGGLAGKNSRTITAAYSLSPVKAADNTASVGGLVGSNHGTITATYSRSPVKATGNGAKVGGLVGWNSRSIYSAYTTPGIITASYAIGPVVATGTNPLVGGLVGRNGNVDENGQVRANTLGTAVDSYWDIGVSGQSSSALGTGVRGLAVAWHPNYIYPGLFANWNLNLDGVAGKDDPWHFGNGHYPMLKYGGHQVRDQVQLRIGDPAVGQTAPTHWFPIQSQSGLTKVLGQGYVWERSDDGVTGWTIVRSRQDGIGINRFGNGSSRLLIEPYEANKRFRVGRLSREGVWVSGIVSTPARAWSGPTATLTFASGHTAPRVGHAIAISGSDAVRWIRCNDTADNGCEVIVQSATSYTPVAADQGKYLYAYRYYNNAQNVKTMGKTAVIGPVAAAATTP